MAMAALGLATAIGGVAPGVADAKRPNIVVVMTDDQDFRSVAGMRSVRSLLAAHGTKFTNSYATYPLCCPSRATFLTGLYAHNHGVLANDGADGGGYAAFLRNTSWDDTLGVRLRRLGYRTSYIGKFLNDYGKEAPREVPPGWDRWVALTHNTQLLQYGYWLNDNGRLIHHGSEPRDYQTDVLARTAADVIEGFSRADRPFFLALNPAAPHTEPDTVVPFGAPRNPRPAPRDWGKYGGVGMPRVPSFNEHDLSDKPAPFRASNPPLTAGQRRHLEKQWRSRMESLLAVDDAVARLVRTLKRTGEMKRTVFVFTSDNGFMLGEHRLKGKTHFYEESARVPLIVRGPGFPRDAKRTQLVGNIDLAPTFIDLAGGSTRKMDGVPLTPLARNPHRRERRAIVIERAAAEGRPFHAIRAGSWKYAELRGGIHELYDLARDPYELRNLARSRRHRAVLERLDRRLHSLKDCKRSACR